MTTITTVGRIKDLAKIYSHPGKLINATWDEAFVRCLCLGPWRKERRAQVRTLALSALENAEGKLHKMKDVSFFPFQWQITYASNMIAHLNAREVSMGMYCNSLMRCYEAMWPKGKRIVLENFFSVVSGGDRRGSKVLWLFLRDFIRIPAFPIDRHIKRFLQRQDLPVNSWRMMDLCIEAGVDAGLFNRGIIFSSTQEEPGE